MLWFLLSFGGFCQHSEEEILQKLRSFQVKKDAFYDAGLFPSERKWSFFHGNVADNTLFFTASIISTLRMNEALMSSASREVLQRMAIDADKVIEKYKSRNGGPTYNFWQTAPPDLPFPNSNSLISNKRGRLPDDFNTTILVVLSRAENDSVDRIIKQKMAAYSARSNRGDVKLITPRKYASSKAYEIWFGKDMPQTFDLCVLSNIMLYVMKRDFKFNQYDEATTALINQMILDGDHRKRISEVAHHTSSVAVVLYHVGRLLAVDDLGRFDAIKETVLKELQVLAESTESEIEKIMILSSLLRLGQDVSTDINFERFMTDVSDFNFFVVNPSNISTGTGKLLPSIYWKSEAYSWALYLEYVLLRKMTSSKR